MSHFRGFHLAFILGLAVSGCAPPRDLNSQLVLAARQGDISRVEELLSLGANVNAPEDVKGEGRPALFHAAAAGHTNVVKVLISKGANVNEQPSGRSTGLMVAAYGGHVDTVRLLLDAGASAKAVKSNGWTALHEAARQGHPEIVKTADRPWGRRKQAAPRWEYTALLSSGWQSPARR